MADTRSGAARFTTTHWTLVLDAVGEGPQKDAAMEAFCRAYWYPLYGFARRRSQSPEAAADLVQEFFNRMLEQGWLSGVERRETRFSTFLLTIFQRFLASEHRRATAEKRGAGQAPISMDLALAEGWFGAEPTGGDSPERAFERSWAMAVLARGMKVLADECEHSGRGRLFACLQRFLSQEPQPGEYAEAGKVLGINARAVASAVCRLRQQFRLAVRAEVAAGLTDPSRVDEEMRYLAQSL